MYIYDKKPSGLCLISSFILPPSHVVRSVIIYFQFSPLYSPSLYATPQHLSPSKITSLLWLVIQPTNPPMTDSSYSEYQLQQVANTLSEKYFGKSYSYSDDVDFTIFTTLRYDPLTYTGTTNLIDAINSIPLDASFFYLLQKHVDKLRRAGEFFKFPVSNLTLEILLHHLTNALSDSDRLIAHRIKISIDKTGLYSIDHAPLPQSHTLSTEVPDYSSFQKTSSTSLVPGYLEDWTGWSLYLDTEKSQPTPFTSFKTSKRDVYNDARARFNIVPGDHREVLLQDNNDNVLEGSITSVAFWRQLKDPLSGELSFKWVTPNLASGCMDGVIRKWLLDQGSIVEGVLPVKELQDGEYVLLMNGLMGIKVAKLIL